MEVKYKENGIDRAMAMGRLPTNEKGKVEFSRKELAVWADLLIKESVMKAMICCTGYLMDEPGIDFNQAEKVDAFWDGVTRYMKTINDPESGFKVKDLIKVIYKYTGTKVFW